MWIVNKYKKVLNLIIKQEDTHLNHNEIPFYTPQTGLDNVRVSDNTKYCQDMDQRKLL